MKHIVEILKGYNENKVIGEVDEDELIKSSVTIRKSDLEKLGRKLMKEIDNFLHSEDIINNFPETKSDREYFDRSVNMFKDKYESLGISEIYHILTRVKLDQEIDLDLYFENEGYLNLFQVLYISYTYLEN